MDDYRSTRKRCLAAFAGEEPGGAEAPAGTDLAGAAAGPVLAVSEAAAKAKTRPSARNFTRPAL